VDDSECARLMLERHALLLRDKIREFAAMTPQQFREAGIKLRDPRSYVLRQMAIEDGISYNSLKQKLSRARQTMGTKAETKTSILKFEGVETFGLPAPNEWKQQQQHLRNKLKGTWLHLESLRNALDAACDALGYPPQFRGSIRSVLDETQRRLRAFVPIGLCRFCKGLDPYQGECTRCERTGIGVESQLADCPEELKRDTPLMVMWRGKLQEVERV
jgi:hypothetical protein